MRTGAALSRSRHRRAAVAPRGDQHRHGERGRRVFVPCRRRAGCPDAILNAVSAPTWARVRVHEALTALGGVGRAVRSCTWHVIGLEWPLARWSTQELGRGQEVAKGVLIATLCFLDVLYSGRRSAA
jgi:hypothetical protein